MIRCIVTVLVAILLLGVGSGFKLTEAAPAPKWTETESDLAQLQGTWVGVSMDYMGEHSKATDATLIFDNGKFTFKRADMVVYQGTFVIDASKGPRTIDMTVTYAHNEPDKGRVILGLYQIKDDTLKWCHIGPGGERSPKYPQRGRPEEIASKVMGDMIFTFNGRKP